MFSILLFYGLFFVVGLGIPFLFLKKKRAAWMPPFLFLIVAIYFGVKSYAFPGEGMADLGERVYMMLFGLAAIGSFLGAYIVTRTKK
jgi:hypothetical protein